MTHQDSEQAQPTFPDRRQAMDNIRRKLALLPDQPGCYLMKNGDGQIIYVGKAKVLKNRVRSYFNGSHDGKTQRLVSEIRDFEYIVTASNTESLILECNLIKQHFPRYNVLLKDDKSFPYIKITNEDHPRLEVTRRILKDKAKYFGPYPNAYAAQETKKLLDRLYPLRKCNNPPEKVCLYYHLGQCLAHEPYEKVKPEYERIIAEITRFLNGGFQEIKKELQRKMTEAAEALLFERASEYRDQIASIETIMVKQTINVQDMQDRDVFGYAVDKGWMCVQILYMRQGKMVQRHMSVFPFYSEAYEDFLSYVTQYYSDNPAMPREMLIPAPDRESEAASAAEVEESLHRWLGVKVHMPRRGAKRSMVTMACDNARVALEEKFRLIERDIERSVGAAAGLARWLGIPSAGRIEAFDNSNIQGVNPVSAMVVFTNGKPDKKEYRKYNVKTVEGPDDYETMREVVRRRYERVLKEGLALPDLIVVDGGRGHIAAAADVLVNELGLDVPVCGLAKDAKHRTAQLLVGDPPEEVPLPRDSQEFYLLQRIQDEVHRFAITFHREKRAKSMIASRLDAIPGIGEKRRKQLLRHFGSLKAIREAAVEDFRAVSIGETLARRILDALREEEGADAATPPQ